jgi:hypothetical protein
MEMDCRSALRHLPQSQPFPEDFLMPVQTPAPRAPAAPPAPDAVAPAVAGDVIATKAGLNGVDRQAAAEAYTALKAERKELGQQLETLEDQRASIASRLHADEPAATGADRDGLEKRITSVDQRIATVEKQIATTDAEIARAAAVPGAVTVVPPPSFEDSKVPNEAWVLSGMFMLIVFLPLSLAYARRIWRRGAAAVAALPADLLDRLTKLEHATESIAVEIERVGEGQRYLTKVFTESPRALGAGAAEYLEVKQREKVGEKR